MKTFVVLGMHRSATSLVAKALSHEIHMGDTLLEANAHNPEGYYENRKFLLLNNKILSAAGGSWRNPPEEEKIILQFDIFKDEIRSLIEEESCGKELWGWKEPRTTLTIRLYYPFLVNPHFISAFRDPKEIAKSLYKFKGVPENEGIALAKLYNDRMIAFLEDFYNERKII